ncbi:MAG: methyltransferase domain-containing protein [Pseudomonadota bacterium]
MEEIGERDRNEMTDALIDAVPLLLSSGDLIADRRFAYAADYAARGDHHAARDLLQQVLERTPAWAAAWFALGEACAALDKRDAARAAYEQALAAAPDDALGASLKLAQIGAVPVPNLAPDAYVKRLFDDYADRFEAHLVDRLFYCGPQLLADAVARLRQSKFTQAIDLGCGTGLCGARFRPHVEALAGVDLSPRMIAQARAKRVYDRLAVADIETFLKGEAAGSADLLLAADVLVYIGDLRPFFAAASRVLRPKGLFAITAQTASRGFELGDDLRYAHAPGYIREAAQASGLSLRLLEDAVARRGASGDVPGLVAVLEK